MTDLATLRRADATSFASGEWRHIVVKHEAIGVFAHQCIDLLFVACGAKRSHYERLGFTASKQGRTVRTRQYAVTDCDRTYGACITTVNARFAFKNLRTNDFGFQIKQNAADFSRIRSSTANRCCFRS